MFTGEHHHYLDRGCIYVSTGAGTLQTVLGSCVSVCLWDDGRKCGGMNHYVYPQTSQKEVATAKYGNVAIVALLKLMQEEGCTMESLTAQIIGGGHPEGLLDSTGWRNVEVARKMLKERRIAVLSEDVGGCVGRKVAFDMATGHIAVLKVHKVRNEDWVD